jgi:hypothetical protein
MYQSGLGPDLGPGCHSMSFWAIKRLQKSFPLQYKPSTSANPSASDPKSAKFNRTKAQAREYLRSKVDENVLIVPMPFDWVPGKETTNPTVTSEWINSRWTEENMAHEAEYGWVVHMVAQDIPPEHSRLTRKTGLRSIIAWDFWGEPPTVNPRIVLKFGGTPV